MCNGLRVREITSPKSANALSAAARTVSANLPGARVAREFPAGVSGRYLPHFGTRLPAQYSTIHQWKSRPRSPLGNSIERALATKQYQTKSFESLEHRLRCPTAFRFRETVGSIPSGGSPEVSQIQQGKEVKEHETPESRIRETRTAYCAWWHETRAR
jgi:hypothetical protein